MKSYSVTIQIKATEQYFPVVLLISLCKVVLTFESVDEILKCDHSNDSYWAVLSSGTVCYALQGGSNFWVLGWNPKVWPFRWKLQRSPFLWYYLYAVKIVHLAFEVRIANALTCQPLLYVGFIMVYNTMFWVNFASDNKQGAGKRLPTLLLSSLT